MVLVLIEGHMDSAVVDGESTTLMDSAISAIAKCFLKNYNRLCDRGKDFAL